MATVKDTIRQGIREGHSKISFSTFLNPRALLEEILDEDPIAAVRVNGWSMSTSVGKCTLTITYGNKDIQDKNIFVASNENECMRILCDCAEACKAKIVIMPKFRTDCERLYQKFSDMYMSFYPNVTGMTIWDSNGLGKSEGAICTFEFKYRIGRVMLDMMERKVDREVAALAKKLFLPDMPTAAKIYLAHNYIASTVEYVLDRSTSINQSYTQSAYGAFINHKCVCQGYAEAFKRLMDYEGIECYMACGTTDAEGHTLHAWNIVSLGEDEGYVHVDATWDTRKRAVSYNYFAKNDRFFSGKRTWKQEILPVCTVSVDLLGEARRYVRANKARLLANGIADYVIDC